MEVSCYLPGWDVARGRLLLFLVCLMLKGLRGILSLLVLLVAAVPVLGVVLGRSFQPSAQRRKSQMMAGGLRAQREIHVYELASPKQDPSLWRAFHRMTEQYLDYLVSIGVQMSPSKGKCYHRAYQVPQSGVSAWPFGRQQDGLMLICVDPAAVENHWYCKLPRIVRWWLLPMFDAVFPGRFLPPLRDELDRKTPILKLTISETKEMLSTFNNGIVGRICLRKENTDCSFLWTRSLEELFQSLPAVEQEKMRGREDLARRFLAQWGECSQTCAIQAVWVAPAYRRRGLASQLCLWLMKEAASLEYDWCVLDTDIRMGYDYEKMLGMQPCVIPYRATGGPEFTRFFQRRLD